MSMKNYTTNNYEQEADDAMEDEDYSAAQIVATLAVAKELHTANVIAAASALHFTADQAAAVIYRAMGYGWKS